MARRDLMASSNISMSFDKETVVRTLQENRKEHEEIYNEAVEGYRKAFEEAIIDLQGVLADKLGELEKEKTPDSRLKRNSMHQLSVPTNSLKEYDTVLEMLELTPDDTIVLDQDQYNCYMKDNWYWMKEFLMSNSVYSMSAATKLSSM